MSNLQLKQELDGKQLAIAQSELENNKKSTVIAYVLWFFLGGLGAHRFFAGKTGSGLIMLGLWGLGWATSWIFGIGFILLFFVYVWVLVDAFLLHGWINKFNQRKEREILLRLANTQ
ncbi:MAG TPA: TM2 domain-containing protein [Pseudogracilibacillus sp.]|nr:TM2 domain-containing protein [Pseudogracilibacillus sp.]